MNPCVSVGFSNSAKPVVLLAPASAVELLVKVTFVAPQPEVSLAKLPFVTKLVPALKLKGPDASTAPVNVVLPLEFIVSLSV